MLNKSLETYLYQKITEALPNYKTNRNQDRIELHATTLLNMCPRRIIISYHYKIPFEDGNANFPLKTHLTFRIGHKIEELAIELLQGKKAPPLGLKINDLYIIGSPDIIVDDTYIIECKSIKSAMFNSLKEPIPSHIAQLSFYLYLAKRLKTGYSTEGAIVYFPKEEASDVVKVFSVRLSELYETRFNRLIDEISQGVKTGYLPKKICMKPRPDCKVAEYCFKEEAYVSKL